MTRRYVGRHRDEVGEARTGGGQVGPAPLGDTSRSRPGRPWAWSVRVPVALVTAAGFAAATMAAAPAVPTESLAAAATEARGVPAQTHLSAEGPVAAVTSPSGPAGGLADSADSPAQAARERVVARMLDARAAQQREASRAASRAAAVVTVRAQAADRARLLAASPLVLAGTDAKSVARVLMGQSYGWGEREFACLEKMWTRESQWKASARNPSSGAHGIPQALPGSKMASAGADWRTNPTTQIRWGLSYIKSRYRTPCGAWAFWQSHHWY